MDDLSASCGWVERAILRENGVPSGAPFVVWIDFLVANWR